jgi:hypothetical protein
VFVGMLEPALGRHQASKLVWSVGGLYYFACTTYSGVERHSASLDGCNAEMGHSTLIV